VEPLRGLPPHHRADGAEAGGRVRGEFAQC
jgi:hypothetical protein